MALVTARTENRWHVMAFSDRFVELPISPRERLDDVLRVTADLPFARTNCALPMLYAEQHGLKVDAFVIYTDNQTWFGDIHPCQALRQYRERSGLPSKLAVVAMTGDRFSIADPEDGGMMDVVGFDTASPAVISDFLRGGE